jgi:hypothetical protein
MPHIEYIHVTINLGTEEGREISEGLSRLPKRQRSAVVRAAILAHLRCLGESGTTEMGGKQKTADRSVSVSNKKQAAALMPRVTQTRPELRSAKTIEPHSTAVNAEPEETTAAEKLKGLFELIQ